MKEFVLTCMCGEKLTHDVSSFSKGEVFTLFCSSCYMNHRYRWDGDNGEFMMRYYFPDD